MSGFARSRDRRPHMPSDTGKVPAFDGAGRGRLPMGKLRGHSPGWWKTPRAAGPSESAASTRSEGKGPKAADAIISKINDDGTESIILGIEFCSALQAGNQAWQRSARAFSTGRTGCPYLYIVDFVKYELNNETRERKNLRFPNAAVPYSYLNYSKNTGNFVAQLYTKSEEFDKTKDSSLAGFSENDFGSEDLGIYIVKLLGFYTRA